MVDFMKEQVIIDVNQTSGTTTTTSIFIMSGVYDNKSNILTDETVLKTLLISRDPKICQGKPVIRGTRISVCNIVELHYLLSWDIQRIRDEYPHLGNEEIIAALEYYESHKKEIDSYLQEETEINAANTAG